MESKANIGLIKKYEIFPGKSFLINFVFVGEPEIFDHFIQEDHRL